MSFARWMGRLRGALGLDGAESTGRRGERLAERWLRRRGYRILQRNLRIGDEEADLIMLDPDGRTIVIVEVKSRASDDPPPELSVGPQKQHRLSRFAGRLMRRPGYADRPIRFDVLIVIGPQTKQPEIRHHPGAFECTY